MHASSPHATGERMGRACRTPFPLAGVFLLLLTGCTSIPADALKLPPDSDRNRALQTRRFEDMKESDLLAASAGVIQDLGFTLDESEARLGLITASRKLTSRRPLNGGEVAYNIAWTVAVPYVAGPFAVYNAIAGVKEPQIVRISLVTQPGQANPRPTSAVRVTAQRVVYKNEKFAEVRSVERLNDPKFYQEFFTRLEKSAFLEKEKNAL